MDIVVDASIVAKWFFDEPFTEEADKYLNSQFTCYAPDLLVAEFTNIVTRKTKEGVIGSSQGENTLDRFKNLLCIQYIPTLELSSKAYLLAVELQHPSYDCFYLAAAEHLNSVMVTADRRFHNIVKSSPYSQFITWIDNSPR